MMNKYPMWDGTNPIYNSFTSVAVVCCLVSVALFNKLDLKTSVKNLLSVVPTKWNKFIDSGNTPYFKPTTTVIYKGKYRQVVDTTIKSDEVGLPVVNSDQSLDSFDLSVYKNYYKNAFFDPEDLKRSVIQDSTLDPIIDKEYKVGVFYDLISKTVCTKVLGKTCMIVKPAGKEDMIIHRDNYNRFICDQFKHGEWRKELIDYNNEALKSGSLLHGMYWLFTQIIITDPAEVSNINKNIYEPIYDEIVAIYNAIKADDANIKADKFEIIITALSGFLKSDHPLSFKTLDRSYTRGRFAKDVIIHTNAIINNASMFVIKSESTDVRELYKAITDTNQYVLSFARVYKDLHRAYTVVKDIYDKMELFYNPSKARDLMDILEKKLEKNQTKNSVRVTLLMEHLDEDTKKYVRKHNSSVKQKVDMVKMIMKSMQKIQITSSRELLDKSEIDKYNSLIPSIIDEGIAKIPKLKDTDVLANPEYVMPIDQPITTEEGPFNLAMARPEEHPSVLPISPPTSRTDSLPTLQQPALLTAPPTLQQSLQQSLRTEPVPSAPPTLQQSLQQPAQPALQQSLRTEPLLPLQPTLQQSLRTEPLLPLQPTLQQSIRTGSLPSRPSTLQQSLRTRSLPAIALASTPAAPIALPTFAKKSSSSMDMGTQADNIHLSFEKVQTGEIGTQTNGMIDQSIGPEEPQPRRPTPSLKNAVLAASMVARLQRQSRETSRRKTVKAEAYKMFADSEAQQRLISTKINDGLDKTDAANWSLFVICQKYMSRLSSYINQAKRRVDDLIASGALDDRMVLKLKQFVVEFQQLRSDLAELEKLVDAIVSNQVSSIVSLPPYIKNMPDFSRLVQRLQRGNDDQKIEQLSMVIEDNNRNIETKESLISELKAKASVDEAELANMKQSLDQAGRLAYEKAKAETEKQLRIEEMERKQKESEYNISKLDTELETIKKANATNQLSLRVALDKEAVIREERDTCLKEKNILSEEVKRLEDENTRKQQALDQHLQRLKDMENKQLLQQTTNAKTAEEVSRIHESYKKNLEILQTQYKEASDKAAAEAAQQIEASSIKLKQTEDRLSQADFAAKATDKQIAELNQIIQNQKAEMQNQYDLLNQKIKQLKDELLSKDAKLVDLDESQKYAEKAVEDYNKANKNFEQAKSGLQEQIDTHVITINNKDVELEGLRQRIEELQKSADTSAKELAEMKLKRKQRQHAKKKKAEIKDLLAKNDMQVRADLNSFTTNAILEGMIITPVPKSKGSLQPIPNVLTPINQPLLGLMTEYMDLSKNDRMKNTDAKSNDKKYLPLRTYVEEIYKKNKTIFQDAGMVYQKINIIIHSVARAMMPIQNVLAKLKSQPDVPELTTTLIAFLEKYENIKEPLETWDTAVSSGPGKLFVGYKASPTNYTVPNDDVASTHSLGQSKSESNLTTGFVEHPQHDNKSARRNSESNENGTEPVDQSEKGSPEYLGNGSPPEYQAPYSINQMPIIPKFTKQPANENSQSSTNGVHIGRPKEWGNY